MRCARLLLKELHSDPLRWHQLEKKMFDLCGSHSKFTSTMKCPTSHGYIIKERPSGSRAPYRINLKKVKFKEDGSVNIKIS